MPRSKHLFVIHGRSTKPSEAEKRRVASEALLHGLNRVDPDQQATLEEQAGPNGETHHFIRYGGHPRVRYSFIYYGDISNQLILERNPGKRDRLSGRDPDHGNQPCEPVGFYDVGLQSLFAHRTQTKAAYGRFLDLYRDRRWIDNVASVVSFLGGMTGLSDKIISIATADMGAYLLTRRWGSAIRDRLQRPLKQALIDGDDVCLVAHSMGCIVSYDVLWKFSRMSEYREVQDSNNRVSKWLTLGNPLGEPGVRDNLYDADEPEDGRFPHAIIKDWINMSAQDDFICHDPTVRDDFKAMKRRGHLDKIDDRKIYNFWIGATATNPHKFYGYLDNRFVAREITDWMIAS